ncbi:MAG: hypothetical protein HY567_00355 [Candidatus Kerfeldbacteria bacterium]|nr:hypothetical protein [Candidatus Kerfeldbacteria bacterium]
MDGGGYWRNYQTCQDTGCHCNGCQIWTHWANCCYTSCDGRECQDHSDWIDNPDYYVDDFGSRSCTSAGNEYASGSFTVVVNGAGVGTTSSHSLTVAADSLRPGSNSWYVTATNSFGRSASSATWSFNLEKKATVEGTVYYDPLSSAGLVTKCAGPTGTTIKPGGGSKVRVNPDGREGPVQGNGSYKVNRIEETGLKTISLGGMDSQFICTCPNGCGYNNVGVTIDGPNIWNFFVADVLPKWAQVLGGHVHGQTGTTVEVPADNYFIVKSSLSNEPGAGTKTSGSFNVSPGSLSTTGWDLTDQLTQSVWRYSYQRLWIRAGSPATDPGDGYNLPAAGIYAKTGDWSISGGEWQNLAGSRIIFVNGDLNINAKISLAGSGDFLAVIVSGDINVDPAVGNETLAPNPSPAQATLTGVFLANGDFRGGSTRDQRDKQLIIYGTVGADIDLDGVGRVEFQRDLGVGNRTAAGTAVLWNPNLILNVPEQLTDALTDWREVAP